MTFARPLEAPSVQELAYAVAKGVGCQVGACHGYRKVATEVSAPAWLAACGRELVTKSREKRWAKKARLTSESWVETVWPCDDCTNLPLANAIETWNGSMRKPKAKAADRYCENNMGGDGGGGGNGVAPPAAANSSDLRVRPEKLR